MINISKKHYFKQVKGTPTYLRQIKAKLLKQQNYKCSICAKLLIADPHQTHLDHNQQTGKIRGMLCHNCNIGLGYFSDSTWLLAQAIKYIKQNK